MVSCRFSLKPIHWHSYFTEYYDISSSHISQKKIDPKKTPPPLGQTTDPPPVEPPFEAVKLDELLGRPSGGRTEGVFMALL